MAEKYAFMVCKRAYSHFCTLYIWLFAVANRGCFAFCEFGIRYLQVQIPEIGIGIWMCKFVKCIFRGYVWSLFLPESSSPPQTAGRRDLRDSQRVEIHAKLLMFSKMILKTGIWPFGANRKKMPLKRGTFPWKRQISLSQNTVNQFQEQFTWRGFTSSYSFARRIGLSDER